MTTISSHTTRATGTILTAAIYNADHNNHVANALALNASKLEGANPPVVDGHAVVFEGVDGIGLRSAGFAPGNMLRSENLSGLSDNATAFNNIKQNATDALTGVVEHATAAEIRSAAAGNLVETPANRKSAKVDVALTDDANVAVDCNTFINATLTIAGNRTLAQATNLQPGDYRTIRVSGNDLTMRTLAFHANYLGTTATIANINSAAGNRAMITLFMTTTNIIVHSVVRF